MSSVWNLGHYWWRDQNSSDGFWRVLWLTFCATSLIVEGKGESFGSYMVGKVLGGGCYRNKEPAQGRAKCGPGGSHNATHQGPYHA
jgi:hypothetical protein